MTERDFLNNSFFMPNKSSSQHSKQANAHGEHVIRLARQLADGNRPGVLATVGRNGAPHLRWMSTVSLQEFPHLYALSSPASRKIAHIRENPHVSWMFTAEMSSLVVNLSGTAQVVTEKSEINRIWRLIENKTNAFFLSLDTKSDGVAVIDTVIEDVECIVPRYDLHYPAKDGDSPLLSAQTDEPPSK
jgi:general stress protein 26